MLFNSYIFIFCFLPVTLGLFYLFGARIRHQPAITLLIAASLFYYAWWNPPYLLLLLFSIFFNYILGALISAERKQLQKKILLIAGSALNLGLLIYFKYTCFILENVNLVFDTSWSAGNIFLPLGISFYTFQQMAYLVDAYEGKTKEYNFSHYCLFVTFFPQLIAGPIVHHHEMLKQFARKNIYAFDSKRFAMGVTIFAIGLFKKVVIADNLSKLAGEIFSYASASGSVTFLEAWVGVLAYTFQLYFDFSGYSDMAIGLGNLFNIRLPLNFNSPYQSVNIVEFWRRWHMTLSRFLRDYVYIPLGGNRKGKFRRYFNLLLTMFLGGLWHGAGWTFVLWGVLHGLYLIINHGWITFRKKIGWPSKNSAFGNFCAGTVTFLAVVVGWVFFRSNNFETAIRILKGMVGLNGVYLPDKLEHSMGFLSKAGIGFRDLVISSNSFGWIGGMALVVFLCPNSIQLFRRHHPTTDSSILPRLNGYWKYFAWNTAWYWILVFIVISLISLFSLSQVSEFLYFQF
ncbi:MAG: MBOAT family protein [Victivallaceae bacterium]